MTSWKAASTAVHIYVHSHPLNQLKIHVSSNDEGKANITETKQVTKISKGCFYIASLVKGTKMSDAVVTLSEITSELHSVLIRASVTKTTGASMK